MDDDWPSHLRRSVFGPSKWPDWRGSVRAISGPPSRQTANRRLPAGLLHYRTWSVYGPPTYCGTGHFWPIWYFQMRRSGERLTKKDEEPSVLQRRCQLCACALRMAILCFWLAAIHQFQVGWPNILGDCIGGQIVLSTSLYVCPLLRRK